MANRALRATVVFDFYRQSHYQHSPPVIAGVGIWAIGVDEAGRGPLLGPLVVCAIMVPNSGRKILTAKGVTDSKRLTPAKRRELSSWIVKQCTEKDWEYNIIEVSASEIDIAMQATNLNDLEVEAFSKAINGLLNYESMNNGSGVLLLDACDVNEARFGHNVIQRMHGWPRKGWSIDSKHGMDAEDVVVGAASILAKHHRDHWVEGFKQLSGIDVGSGYPSDPKTKEALNHLLSDNQPHEELRWGWEPVKRKYLELHSTSIPNRPHQGASLPGGQQRLWG